MSRFAQASAINSLNAPQTPRPSLLSRLLRSLGKSNAALEGQARLAAICAETLTDTGLSADTLTGVSTYDAALPFFMQAGFGRDDS